MKKFISCILATAIITSLNIQVFAEDNSSIYLQKDISSSNSALNSDTKSDTLIKEMTKLSRSFTIFENEQQGYILKNIEITDGLKDSYIQGEKINIAGLKAIAVYEKSNKVRGLTENTKREQITILEEDIKGFDSNNTGSKSIAIEINQIQFKKDIEIIENKLESITITKQPTKLIYKQGEALNISGLEVTGKYSDETNKVQIVELKNISGFDSNKIGKQTLTITIDSKTVTFEIEIEESIQIPESEDIKIDRVQYYPPVVFESELKITLNKPTTKELKLEDFSIHCPGLQEMTIQSVSTPEGEDKNRVYILKLPSYSDNKYILEIYLNQNTENEIVLEEEFLVKYTECPIISYPYVSRINDTQAQFKFSSDSPGKIYYLVVKNENTKSRSTLKFPTIADIKKANNVIEIVAESYVIDINNLLPNTTYSIYYLTVKDTQETEIYGPVKIQGEPEPSATSKITITESKVLEDAETQSVKITLSEPTTTPLQLKDFEIKCPAGSNLRFDKIIVSNNKIYTLIMYGGFKDNNYEVKINFPDGTFATSHFRSQLKTPTITGVSQVRTSKNTATVTLNSDLDGLIYYGITNERFKCPTVAEILATGERQTLHTNTNIINLENVPENNAYFYWLAESKSGVRPYFVDGAYAWNKIPDEIQEDKPEVETKIKIDKVEQSGSTGNIRLKVTLSEDVPFGITSLSNIQISNDKVNWIKGKNFSVYSLSSDNPDYKKVFTISQWGDTKFVADTYTLSIEFSDGIATKQFTIQ